MAKKDLTELVFVIDKSGSMTGLESDTVGGYNSLLKSNREGEGEALVSTALFDNDARILHDRVPIEQVRPLFERDYVPGGCTALLDAVGGAIRYHERVQKFCPSRCARSARLCASRPTGTRTPARSTHTRR